MKVGKKLKKRYVYVAHVKTVAFTNFHQIHALIWRFRTIFFGNKFNTYVLWQNESVWISLASTVSASNGNPNQSEKHQQAIVNYLLGHEMGIQIYREMISN